MFENYLKTAVRNLLKHKLYSFINIVGLALGLASTILIFLWAHDELNYDSYHKNADKIYRINWDFNWNGNEGIGSGTPPPLAEAISREIPEVEEATRVRAVSKMVVRYGEHAFNEDKIFGADPNLFDFFTFEIISGNAETALSKPNSVVLTESIAQKYFGDEPALGKIITIGEEKTDFRKKYDNVFEVTGVIKNPPRNSHFQFEMLTSMASHPTVLFFDWSWIWMQVVTYAKLEPGATPQVVESKIPALVEKYAPAAFERVGFSYDELISSGGRWDFVLQPMTDIYLGDVSNRLGTKGNRVYVYLFLMIAAFVLFLACINFMNLTTARSSQRAKEIGIRKTLGSAKRLLVGQFLLESMVYSFLALPLSLFMVEVFIRPFSQLSGKILTFNLFDPWWLSVALTGLTLFVGLLAGSYPGFYLSSFRPVEVLKGKMRAGHKGTRLRNGLVVFQFAITIGLIVSTLLVRQQMDFLQNADLGFSKEGVVIIFNENNLLGSQAEAFKEKLKSHVGIVSASISTGVPPYSWFDDYYKIEGRGDEQFTLASYLTDEDFCTTLDIQIVEGRGFSRDFSREAESVVLNEAAVRYLGWDDPIGKRINYSGANYTVIGVMKDFNLMALYSPIRPFALFHHSSKAYSIENSYVVVRIQGNGVAEKLQLLETEWQKFAPNTPFVYEFLDQSFQSQYVAEQRLGRVFMVFSLLTVFIACIGLLGLAAFSAEQRTKEIGVRKVLGASVSELVLLLSKEFTKWVILANVIAWPIAYFAMNQWLQDFAYRINITWSTFVISGVVALAIALITVSAHAIRAAMANPVQSLRYE